VQKYIRRLYGSDIDILIRRSELISIEKMPFETYKKLEPSLDQIQSGCS